MATVSHVMLKELATKKLRPAELWDVIEERHLVDIESHWASSLVSLSAASQSHEESSHWNWRRKLTGIRGQFGRQEFAIECDGHTQGIMLLDLNKASRIPATKGESIVYVDYLQAAPWNRKSLCVPQFRLVGSILIAASISLSLDLGFDGRIGLHSLPQSEGFYDRCKMTKFWGDPDYEQLMYYEMTTSQSAAFLNKGGAA